MKQNIFMTSYKTYFLIFASLLYIGTHFWFLSDLQSHRHIVWEPDDSYHFLLKATNIKDCLFQDCPGLDDISKQVYAQTDDKQVKWVKDTHSQRLLLSYHPVLSFLILGINLFGIDYENVFFVFQILFFSFSSIAIAYFNKTLFGKIPAALSLIAMSSFVFSSTATFLVKAYMFACFFAILAWAVILSEEVKKRYSIALVLMSCSVLCHPVGLILAGLTVLLEWVKQVYKEKVFPGFEFNKFKHSFIFAVVSVLVLLFFYKFRLNFVNIDIKPLSLFQETDISVILSANYQHLSKLLGILFSKVHYVLLLVLCFVGLYKLDKNQSVKIYSVITVLGIALLVSLFCPATVSPFIKRIWIPFIVFMTGLVGKAVWNIFQMAFRDNLIPKWASVLLLCSFSLLFVQHYNIGITDLKSTIQNVRFRQDFNFYPEAVLQLKEMEQKEKLPILFNMHVKKNGYPMYEHEEALLHFFLLHGIQKHNMILGNLAQKEEIPERGYFSSLNPISYKLQRDLLFNSNTALQINNPNQLTDMKLFLLSKQGGVVNIINGEKRFQLKLKRNDAGWKEFKLDPSEKLILFMEKGEARLAGINFDLNSQNYWPWDQNLSFNVLFRRTAAAHFSLLKPDLKFSLTEYSKEVGHPLDSIIYDKGSSFIARW